MLVQKYRISLFSADPDRLAEFYVKVLGFKQIVKVDREEDYGFGIEATQGYKLWIARHSKVHGKNSEPFRIMLSLYVDSIAEYFSAIKTRSDMKIIEEPTPACVGIKGEERMVGAFLDPDGNCVQLIQLL